MYTSLSTITSACERVLHLDWNVGKTVQLRSISEEISIFKKNAISMEALEGPFDFWLNDFWPLTWELWLVTSKMWLVICDDTLPLILSQEMQHGGQRFVRWCKFL
jgi:hypothetical protein